MKYGDHEYNQLLKKIFHSPTDIDNDSRLSRNDLTTVLSMVTDGTLKEAEISEIIDKVGR